MKRAVADRDIAALKDHSEPMTHSEIMASEIKGKHDNFTSHGTRKENQEDEIIPTQEAEPQSEIAFCVKWCGSKYAVELYMHSTVLDLKQRLYELTEVHPKRQKVVGLPFVFGKPPGDTQVLKHLKLRPDLPLMLFGTREADISALNAACEENDDIINDLDADDDGIESDDCLLELYRKRLERRIETTEFRIINAPRPGKKLLVLDLDYTLFDCRGGGPIENLGRPGLHEFLASAYHWYDIVVWSQTSWRWLEAKLTGLSVLFSSEYKLTFVLDRTSMFPISSRKGKSKRTHEVKALEIIWRTHKQWNSKNTIHIDDLSKNFALNPQSGLKITPFKNALLTRQFDRELYDLKLYLVLIAQSEADFTKLKHENWRQYCLQHSQDTTEPNLAENSIR